MWGAIATALCSGCPSPVAERAAAAERTEVALPRPAPDPLALDYDRAAFDHEGKLLDRLRSSPFAYFRYLAGPFARTVCDKYEPTIGAMPTVNLHGDVHVEQYAVADDGFGIVDFDDATKGPPLLDWLRFATSLFLAAKGDEGMARAALDRFVEGYQRGLSDPNAVMSAPEPSAAKRIRQGFDTTPAQWLDRVTALIRPLDNVDEGKMQQARRQYIGQILKQNPDLTESFFALKKGGALDMGIGSAHEKKFLVRVEGPTAAPDDDVLLEKKQMKHQLLGRCVRGDASDPTRVINAQSRFSRSPQRFLGYVVLGSDAYYVHAWRVHYTELRVDDLRSPEELAEIAYDVGLQLGRGHPMFPYAAEESKKERQAIAHALAEVLPTLANDARDLAERTTRGYERFREASSIPSRSPTAVARP